MANLEFGQDWLALADPLQAFELAKGSVEFTAEVRPIAYEEIGNFLGRNTRLDKIEQLSLCFDIR